MKHNRQPQGIFITGTDTNVGKTVISAILCHGMKADYWKPVQSGSIEGTDSDWIKQTTQLPAERFYKETYCLQEPLSPHLAATIDGVTIEPDKIAVPKKALQERDLIVEGAGGILVPLNDQTLVIDLIAALSLPVIVVARSTLGTINHTLLTLTRLREYSIPVLGVVLNGPPNADNAAAIAHFGKTNIIAQVPPLAELSKSTIASAFDRHFGEWYASYNSNANISHLAPVYTNENSGAAVAGQAR